MGADGIATQSTNKILNFHESGCSAAERYLISCFNIALIFFLIYKTNTEITALFIEVYIRLFVF